MSKVTLLCVVLAAITIQAVLPKVLKHEESATNNRQWMPFIQELNTGVEELIKTLEKAVTQDKASQNVISEAVGKLHEYSKTFQGIIDTTNCKSEVNVELAIEDMLQKLEDLTLSEHSNDNAELNTTLRNFRLFLKNLLSKRGTTSPTFNHINLDLEKEVQILFDSAKEGDYLMKATLDFLVRQYYENLREVATPETKATLTNVTFDAAQLSTILKKANEMPQDRKEAVLEETFRFKNRVSMAIKVNTPERYLSVRIRTVTDVLTVILEIVPSHAVTIHKAINKEAIKFGETLERIASKLRNTQIDQSIPSTLESLVHQSKRDFALNSFIGIVKETTMVILKGLLDNPSEKFRDIAADYLTTLQIHQVVLREIIKDSDVVLWTMHTYSILDMFSTYFDEGDSNAANAITENVKSVIESLERYAPEGCATLIELLRNVTVKRENDQLWFNHFTMRGSLLVSQIMWKIFYDTNTDIPVIISNLDFQYADVVAEVFASEIVDRVLQTIQTPEEILANVYTVADYVINNVLSTTVDIKITKYDYIVQNWQHILTLATFKIERVSTCEECRDISENLGRIRQRLSTITSQPETFTVIFVRSVDDALLELNRLLLQGCHGQDDKLVEIYTDFLYGLRHIDDQIQYYLAQPAELVALDTYVTEMSAIYSTLSTLVKRAHWKPELKEEFVYKMHFTLLFVMEDISSFQVYPVVANKLHQSVYSDLQGSVDNSSRMTIGELSDVFDKGLQNYITTIGPLIELGQPDIQESTEEFLYLANMFGLTMARLQRIYNYDYYNHLNLEEIVAQIREQSGAIVAKLTKEVSKSEQAKYAISIQILRFASVLRQFAQQLQTEGRMCINYLFETVCSLQKLGGSTRIRSDNIEEAFISSIEGVLVHIEELVKPEFRLGARNALVQYLVALEEIHVSIDRIGKLQDGWSAIAEIDRYAGGLTRVLGRLASKTSGTTDFLRDHYHHLLNATGAVAAKLPTTSSHANDFKHALKNITQNENRINKSQLATEIALDVQRIVGIFRKLPLIPSVSYNPRLLSKSASLATEKPSFTVFLKRELAEVLTAIQKMHADIEKTILFESAKCPQLQPYSNDY